MVPVAKVLRTNTRCTTLDVEPTELLVVGSGTARPQGSETSASVLASQDAAANLTNTVGFLGGVLTKTIPYEDCRTLTVDPSSESCKLRYDRSSVALRGMLTDTLCGGPPPRRTTVRLTELNPTPGEPARERTTRSDHTGAVEIGALEAGSATPSASAR